MKLQEILNYRSECLIHHKPMSPCANSNKIKDVKVSGTDLEVLYRLPLNDEMSSLKVSLLDDKIVGPDKFIPLELNNPLVLAMRCEECSEVPLAALQATSIDNLIRINNYYTFSLLSAIDGTLTCQLEEESIRYTDDDAFYHLRANCTKGNATITMGQLKGKGLTVEEMIRNTMRLAIPKIDFRKFITIEQVVAKVKFYNLFS